MLVKLQIANPCGRKGDSHFGPSHCECIAACKKLKDFKNAGDTGTRRHHQKHSSQFQGCLPLEERLIKEKSIRYETREESGLEVLFEGVEFAQNLNSEVFTDTGEATSISGYLDTVGNFLTDAQDNDRKLTKGIKFHEEGLKDFLPADLGFAQSGASAFAITPETLEDSFFETMYARGDFRRQNDDVQNLAVCLFHRIDIPSEIKKIWPRYIENRYEETHVKLWSFVHRRMPPWAKKFNRIWSRLTTAQADALKLEFFYADDEKASQSENAKTLGISIASYQERLEWAYKKLEALYPEFERIARKQKDKEHRERPKPYPLYNVLPDGNKTEIPTSKPRDKDLSAVELRKIRRWADLSSTQYFVGYGSYSDVEDFEDETAQQDIEDAIEQEHQDFLKVKEEEAAK